MANKHKIGEGSIKVVKLKKPEKIGKKKYKYEVFYTDIYVWGHGSLSITPSSVLAENKKEADTWVKVLKKDVAKLGEMI